MVDFIQNPAAIAAAFAVLYALLLILLFVRRTRTNALVLWTIGYLALSAIWQLSAGRLIDAAGLLPLFPVSLLAVSAIFLSVATARYLERTLPRWWVPFALALAAALFLWETFFPGGRVGIFHLPLTAGHLGSLLLWFLVTLTALVWTLQSFRLTPFPWHANRYLFWWLAVLLIWLGETLSFVPMPTPALQFLGYGVRFLGAAGLAYAATTIVRFDVRTRFRRALAFPILLLATTIPAAALYFLFIDLSREYSQTTAALIISVLAALIFLLYIPLHRHFERLIYHFLLGEPFQTGAALRKYTQSTASSLEIEQLAAIVFEELDQLFGISRGALFLVEEREAGFAIEPIPAAGEINRQTHLVEPTSRFIQILKTIRQPLLQFEIELNPVFEAIKIELLTWLTPLEMELYAPIRSAGNLEGFIALGPKRSGYTFRSVELDLIQLLADQTAVALENARLYREVAVQNERVRHLNLDLIRQNERLETLDKIKSDFITIASHELRTPLTQIKGYNDILASLNEENALTREQTRQIVSQIERASGTLDQLISAMLDASQIDVDEMRMNMTETHIETILRLAQEPLSQALRDRRLRLEVNFDQPLPAIQGDFKRLVQAFTNILGNAVKYTPDHGLITVNGRLLSRVLPDNPVDKPGDQAIEITITDTGIGISPANQELIFEKFFRLGDTQLHSTSATKFMGAGPGLGLTIAKGVIEAHGGRIWVESEGEDRERLPGATFAVVLPVCTPESSPPPALTPTI